ncbi:Xylanase regulator 1 [Hyphodiscus hymeniophilus]|uniref:Xylanase regulator 1 n=1 Tax=Hyphodiscus hymeniophilus TaxID=353542 RepID=A0A9P7B1E5_9HELO|nr:Xylanase regulator 1 [Hyphodiscus hymeniophilus]
MRKRGRPSKILRFEAVAIDSISGSEDQVESDEDDTIEAQLRAQQDHAAGRMHLPSSRRSASPVDNMGRSLPESRTYTSGGGFGSLPVQVLSPYPWQGPMIDMDGFVPTPELYIAETNPRENLPSLHWATSGSEEGRESRQEYDRPGERSLWRLAEDSIERRTSFQGSLETASDARSIPESCAPLPSAVFDQISEHRYPVLNPVLPYLANVIKPALANELLNHYCTTSSLTPINPSSSYILGQIFRKQSLLHPTHPRLCSPVLLATILWAAAQDYGFLASHPSSRKTICDALFNIITTLLQTHRDRTAAAATSTGYGYLRPSDNSLDRIVSYIHIATGISAGEQKAASIKWWSAAWALAWDSGLCREPSPTTEVEAEALIVNAEQDTASGGICCDREMRHYRERRGRMTSWEERREERRRVWWLLYIVDRHLGLCYNRPLFLRDAECQYLYHPLDETAWQNGNLVDPAERQRGISYECTGTGIFGFFLPLMGILGEIVDLQHFRRNPSFQKHIESSDNFKQQVNSILLHLGMYEKSLDVWTKSLACVVSPLGENGDGNTPSLPSVRMPSKRS